jgi:hypothetical protein
MTTSSKRLALYLILGITVGLLVTACAGLATGTVHLPGGTILLQSMEDLNFPALRAMQPAATARQLEAFEKAALGAPGHFCLGDESDY